MNYVNTSNELINVAKQTQYALAFVNVVSRDIQYVLFIKLDLGDPFVFITDDSRKAKMFNTYTEVKYWLDHETEIRAAMSCFDRGLTNSHSLKILTYVTEVMLMEY